MNTLTREEIEDCRRRGVHPSDGEATLNALCDMALRSEAQPVASKRDTDWILAIGAALGMDSGFSIPIVPEVEPFRQLFAALRASPPPQPAPEVGEETREKMLAEALRIALTSLSRIALTVTSGNRLREYAQDALSAVNEIDPAALSARRVSEAELESAVFYADVPAHTRIGMLARAVLRFAGGEHG